MNVVVGLLFLLIAAGIAGYLYWHDHPAVQLKRQIRQRLQLEQQAQEALDAGYEQAKATMDRLADDWVEQ